MNGKFLLRLSALLVVFSFGLAAGSVGLFTTGTWQAVGDFNPAATVYYGLAADSFGAPAVTPADANPTMLQIGGNFDQITSGAVLGITGLGGMTATGTTLDTAVAGLLYSDINALIGDTALGVANGSAIWKALSVAGGDTLDLQFNFVSNDTVDIPGLGKYDDLAFFAAIDGANTLQSIQLLARTDWGAANSGVLGFGVGDWGTSGWVGLHYAVPTTGTYKFVFGSVNVGPVPFDFTSAVADTTPLMSDSALLLDAVPEPGTWFLVTGSVLLVPALLRRRKK